MKTDAIIDAHAIKVLVDVVVALADASEVEQTYAVLKPSSMSFLTRYLMTFICFEQQVIKN
jgi:hypothetical protein